MPGPGVSTHRAAQSVAPLCFRPLSRCGMDAHPHAGLCGHPDWLCLQPGPVSPGRYGLGHAPLAPPAARGLCAFFRLLHLLLVCGPGWAGVPKGCPEGCKGQDIPQIPLHTPLHRLREGQGQRSNPGQCLHGTDGRTEGGRICPPGIQFFSSPRLSSLPVPLPLPNTSKLSSWVREWVITKLDVALWS